MSVLLDVEGATMARRWGAWVVAAAAMVVGGCMVPAAPPEPGDVWAWEIDPGFNAAERATIDAALATWTERSVVTHVVATGPSAKRIVRVARGSARDLEYEARSPGWSGYYDGPRDVIELASARAAEHELGHALGLADLDSAGLMGAPIRAWDEDDAAECRRVRACR